MKKYSKLLKRLLSLFLVFSWLLTSWPGIIDLRIKNLEFRFPPKTEEIKAISCGFGSEIGSSGVCRGFLTTTGSLQTWTSPSDWNNSNNTIECIGAGGSGGAIKGSTTAVATGGGGGAYSLISNFYIADPGTTQATYMIGSGGTSVSSTGSATPGNAGGDTWFNSSTFPGSGTDNTYCGAKGGSGGLAGTATQNGGAGGVGTSGWGETRRSGGAGGTASHASNATGGGGAAGNSTTGGNGVNSSGTNNATNGGQANGSGALGGTGVNGGNGNSGSDGTEYSTEGSGGGGGGGRNTGNIVVSGGNGGKRGGGGGGAVNYRTAANGSASSGAGYAGIIIITYTPAYTNIATGTDPASTTVAPGSGIREAGAFTFQTNTGTDTITQLNVSLAGSGTPYEGLAQAEIRVTSCSGTQYYNSITSFSGNSLTFSGGTSITATTSQTEYKICLTPKTHANMPVPPGAEYNLNPTVTDWAGTNAKAGSDTNSNTLTVDNLSPNGATSTSGSAGDAQVTLNWTTSNSSDFSRSVVLRWTGAFAGSEVPAEGSDYSVDDTITTATVACVRTSDSASIPVSGTDGAGTGGCSSTPLSNGQSYTYKVFQKDTRGNYDTGVSIGTFMPASTPAYLTQNDWRVYVDDNTLGLTGDDPWPSGSLNLGENEALMSVPPENGPISVGDNFRLRMSIAISTNTLSASSTSFTLQYKEASDCTDGTSWSDVDAISGSGVWRYYNASGVADGDTLTNLKLTASDVYGRYSESAPTSTNPNSVSIGQDLEWDWNIQYNGAEEAHTYCFRMVKSGGTPLDAYNSDSYPKLDTRPGVSDIMRHGNFFTTGVKRGFFWTN